MWQGFLIDDVWLLENRGADSAFDVHVQVKADLSEASTHAGEVPPAGRLSVDLSKPVGMIRDQYAQLARAMQKAGNPPPVMPPIDISARINWRTAGGTPRILEVSSKATIWPKPDG